MCERGGTSFPAHVYTGDPTLWQTTRRATATPDRTTKTTSGGRATKTRPTDRPNGNRPSTCRARVYHHHRHDNHHSGANAALTGVTAVTTVVVVAVATAADPTFDTIASTAARPTTMTRARTLVCSTSRFRVFFYLRSRARAFACVLPTCVAYTRVHIYQSVVDGWWEASENKKKNWEKIVF